MKTLPALLVTLLIAAGFLAIPFGLTTAASAIVVGGILVIGFGDYFRRPRPLAVPAAERRARLRLTA
jgi:hypothetical protein